MLSRSVVSDSLWPHGPQSAQSMGILQARILVWVAMPSSKGSSQPRDQTQVSRIAGRFFTDWATRKALKHTRNHNLFNLGHLFVLKASYIAYRKNKQMKF